MANRKFRSAAQGRGFKQLGSGLRASEDRIQEQRKIEIDSLKLSALQREKDDQNYISGMGRAFGMEEFQRKERVKLEDKVRTRKYEALKKLADTDVKRLEDEAKMKQKEVDYWKELTPKAAKALQSSITGIYEFQDTYRGQKYYQALRESGLLEGLHDGEKNITDLFNKDFFKDFRAGKINKDNIENYIVSDALWDKHKNRTSRGALLLLDYLKKNKGSLTAEVVAEAQAAGHTISNTEYADLHEWAAMAILKNAGIPATSRRGSQIIELYRSEGLKVQRKRILTERWAKDQGDIKNQVASIFALIGQNEDIEEEAKNLISMVYGSHVKQGDTVKAPHENGMTWPTSWIGTGQMLVDVGFKDIRSREHLEEILSKFYTIPKKGSTDKPEQFIKKMEPATEQILDYYDEKLAEKNRQGSAKQNEYNVQYRLKLERQIGNQAWQFKTDDNGDLVLEDGKEVPLPEDEVLSKKDWMFSAIRKVSKNPELDAKGKKDAYAELDLLGDTHKVAEQYVIAKEYYNNGENVKARNYISTQTASDQALLKPFFEDIQFLEKAVVPIEGKSPRKTVEFRTKKNVFQHAEGQNFSSQRSQMHSSATYAQRDFVNAVELETIRLGKLPEYEGKPQAAYEQAWVNLTTEFEKGDRAKYGDQASGRWIRRGGESANPAEDGKYLIYENYDTTSDVEVARIIALQKLGLTKELRQVAGVDSKPFSSTDMKTILDGSLFSYGQGMNQRESDQQFLLHPRTVSNKRITSDANIAYQHSLPNGKREPFQIPEIIVEYARLRKLNALDVYRGIISAKSAMTGIDKNIVLPSTSEDVCIDILNNGEWFYNKNEGAVWAYKACQAQGVNPMSFNSEDALNGLSTADAFKQRLDVELTPTSFLQNGGLFKTPVDWSTMESLNLGFYWDAASFQAAQESLKQRRKKKQFIDSRVPIPNNPELTMPIRLKGV